MLKTGQATSLLVIVASQRSGTTALGLALSQDRALHHWGEIFHDAAGGRERTASLHLQTAANYFRFRQRQLRAQPLLAAPDPQHQHELFVRYLEFLRKRSRKPMLSLDIKYNSWHHFDDVWRAPLAAPALLGYLREAGAAFLHIRRRDLLAQACSLYLADHSGRFHSERRPGRRKAVVVPPEWARSAIELSRRHTRLFQQWLKPGGSYLEWDYEDLFDGQQVSVALSRKLGSLLQRPLQAGAVPLKKLSTNLAAEVANYRELSRLFGASNRGNKP